METEDAGEMAVFCAHDRNRQPAPNILSYVTFFWMGSPTVGWSRLEGRMNKYVILVLRLENFI